MLTTVYLDGPMGEKFGREWEFEVDSPRAALKMVDANTSGFVAWMRRTAQKYSNYQVVVEYENGATEELSNETFGVNREMKSIRFVPIIEGSGKWTSTIVGIVIMVVAIVYGIFTEDWVNAAKIFQFGAEMAVVGLITALTTKDPVKIQQRSGDGSTLSSYGFDSTTNTVEQGVPVPIIYGRSLVGSRVISASVVIGEMVI